MKMQILANGIPMRTDNLTDLLMFLGERAEWNARAILENLPSSEPERSHLVIEADRHLAVLEMLAKDEASQALLPDWFKPVLKRVRHELSDLICDYFKQYPEDRATRMLTGNMRVTLKGYVKTATQRFGAEGQ